MQEDAENEFVRLLLEEIDYTIDQEIGKAMGMIKTELRYGETLYIPYTSLDGLERGEIVEGHWFSSIKQRVSKKFSLKKSFPFITCKNVYFTDVILNTGTTTYPEFKHIYALESPQAMAKKFGIVYNDTTTELLKDNLEHGLC